MLQVVVALFQLLCAPAATCCSASSASPEAEMAQRAAAALAVTNDALQIQQDLEAQAAAAMVALQLLLVLAQQHMLLPLLRMCGNTACCSCSLAQLLPLLDSLLEEDVYIQVKGFKLSGGNYDKLV
jgi:hypothetical protein